MKVMKLSMKILFLFLALAVVSCGGSGEQAQKNSSTSAQTATKKGPAKKAPKSKLQSKLATIPLAKKPTKFSIHRMNNRKGSNDLIANPYKLKANENLKVIGVAVDDIAQLPAKEVYLALNGNDIIPTNYGGNSAGFASSTKNPKYKKAGFQITIPYARFKKGKNEIKVIIVGANGKYKFVQPRVYSVMK
jgi:hypothetical protein